MENRKRFVQTKLGVCLCAGICCLLWGSAFPVIKLGYAAFQIGADQPFSVILYAGIRFTLAGLLSLAFHSIRLRRVPVPEKNDWGMVLLLGLFQVVLQYFFMYIGTANTTGVKTAIINASHVFITIALTVFVLKTEKLRAVKVLGCVVGFVGVVLINLSGGGLEGSLTLLGEGFLLISSITAAIATCMMGSYSKRMDTQTLATWQFIIGGGALLALGLIGGGEIRPVSVSAWVMLGYLSFLAAAAYALWSILLRNNPVSTVTVYTFMTPIFGTVLSVLLLGETQSFGLTSLLALALVCCGIYLVNGKHA